MIAQEKTLGIQAQALGLLPLRLSATAACAVRDSARHRHPDGARHDGHASTVQAVQARNKLATAMARMAAAICLAMMLWPDARACLAADDLIIHTERQGDAVVVEARASLAAPLPLIWETLTDYDGLASFIPGMRVSRVVERRGPAAIVKQVGEAGLFFFTRPIDVVVESLEKPPHVIEVRVLSGNLKRLDGRYQIEPDAHTPGRYVLRWFGVIEPQEGLPPIVGAPILRWNIGDQFRGMVREIERRARQRAAAVKK